jgi:FAD/FMN-containing dehydrogenase
VGWLWLLLEGMDEEVAWMARQLQDEWSQIGQDGIMLADAERTETCLSELTEWPAGDAALVLKANVRPSQTVGLVETVVARQPGVSVQAHAGSGIVIFRFAEFPAGGLARTLTASWQPAAAAAGGNVVILSNRSGQEMTRRSVWGNPSAPLQVMRRIKTAFDPHNILNPERFVY